MSTNRKMQLCRYHYDPLDRLANCTRSTQASIQRFYLKSRLASEIQGSIQRSIFQQEDHLLAQQQRRDGAVETTLLTTDQQRSVLHALNATQPCALVYTPYGHRPPENDLLSLLGFNGERPDPVTGHYLLGNGYRAFNPVLMRFNSPDSFSPFGAGGLNAYVYCIGDPVNSTDPSGHYISFSSLWKAFLNFLRPRTPNTPSPATSFQATTVNAANSASRIVNSGSMASASSKPLRGSIPTPAPPKNATSPGFQDSISAGAPSSSMPKQRLPKIGPLPPLPANARLHTYWAFPRATERPTNIYHSPSVMDPKAPPTTRQDLYIPIPTERFSPMETIFESPKDLRLRQQKAREIIERGKRIRYDW
ncbi:RHS repeat-associated core domain-containing protein [Pseudomonas sp. NFACC13-1]|uniref:RHS repeat-associated core domain-containing protein n=1 Tax=Pseudomonas sp. NFACC13-1 TaxID=1566245 RepID=UPI000889E7FB|nr:RHS repeat-associated core domain-containing protein [Pseudomonas sp. NFACC13-1]SDB43955.1 RHS repeat-associated core domain-containing protein [Pseudomonas sp. NFACC13-1]